MTSFDERKRGFEADFARDQDLSFRVTARRNRLLGLWAAERLGLAAGAAAEDYAKTVIAADFKEPGDDDVIEKVRGDLVAGGVKTAVAAQPLQGDHDPLALVVKLYGLRRLLNPLLFAPADAVEVDQPVLVEVATLRPRGVVPALLEDREYCVMDTRLDQEIVSALDLALRFGGVGRDLLVHPPSRRIHLRPKLGDGACDHVFARRCFGHRCC
jgi:hypothetical protein